MKRLLPLAAILLASCANPQGEMALQAPRALVGMPKGELLACAGVPERNAADGRTEYLSYTQHQTIIEREVDYERDRWTPRGLPSIRRPEVKIWRRDFACEATFILRDGRVAELRYNEGRDITLCHRIIANCMR